MNKDFLGEAFDEIVDGLVLFLQGLQVRGVVELLGLELQSLWVQASVDHMEPWKIMATQVEREQLVLQHHLIEGHDVETGAHLATRVEVFARVIQESHALEYVIVAQVPDLVLCPDRLLQFQSCLWAALLARGNVSMQFDR